MRKYLFIILLSTSDLCILNGQNRNTGTISGIITDNQMKKPVEFATIVVQNKNDDSVVEGTITDSTGKFIIENIAFKLLFI